MTHALPSLFVSHGSPMMALEPGDTGAFWRALGPRLDAAFGRPRAIVAVSAHTRARSPVLLAAPRHAAVHDFGGFDARLYTMAYDAPGAPELAPQVQALLAGAGVDAAIAPEAGGLDHGLWIPLRSLWPDADVPVLPLAFTPAATAASMFALGAALAPLRQEGVLVLGSGGITHNLGLFFGADERPPVDAGEIAPSRAFRDWVHDRSRARDWDSLLDWRSAAPHAAYMHPSDEHWLPWYAAAGAGGTDALPQRVHAGVTHGMLGMDAYAFGDEAAALA